MSEWIPTGLLFSAALIMIGFFLSPIPLAGLLLSFAGLFFAVMTIIGAFIADVRQSKRNNRGPRRPPSWH